MIFPASGFGPGYVKAAKLALPFLDVMVTEGITADNIGDCFAADASGIRRNGRPRRGKPAGGLGFFSERGGVESVISLDTGLKCFYN